MHKNLITTFQVDTEIENVTALNNFQQLISDGSYSTFYTIYGKFFGETENGNPHLYKPKKAVFYLQNFTGMVTVGLESIDCAIDLVYDTLLNEPAYLINFYVKPLSNNAFFPDKKEDSQKFKIDENDILLPGKSLDLIDFTLKQKLSITDLSRNTTITNEEEKTIILMEKEKDTFINHNGFLNLKYKFLFVIQHIPYGENTEDSIFVDSKYFERFGETIKLKPEIYELYKANLFGGFVKDGKTYYNDKCNPNHGTGVIKPKYP